MARYIDSEGDKYLRVAYCHTPRSGGEYYVEFDESIRLLENTAYKVIAYGMSVHRDDLESKKTQTDHR